MMPIHELLHRIQWDPEFGGGVFVIGYLDRVAGRVVRVPFSEVRLGQGRRPDLQAIGEDGRVHALPLHRVREVWRDGRLIWERPAGSSRR